MESDPIDLLLIYKQAFTLLGLMRLGSAARMRIPMACYASSFLSSMISIVLLKGR